MTPLPKTISARRRLELSQLTPAATQREAMGKDVDISAFKLYLNSQVRVDVASRMTSASITRTIEGASTLSVTIYDYDRVLLRSGLLSNKLDVKIDGLWFRLVTVDKTGDELTLTFEDREIAVLRTYNKWRIAQRGQMTRAEFVLSLLREVKEFKIPFVIPELHIVQPIERYSGDKVGVDQTVQKGKGIPKNANQKAAADQHRHNEPAQAKTQNILTIKGEVATPDQLHNADLILGVGDLLGVSRKLHVVAIMAAITESRIINDPGGDADSAGCFQQRPSWGSYFERTQVQTSAKLFYEAAIKEDKLEPTVPYWVLAADVQHPREDLRTQYAKWRTEAENIVNAYGGVSSVVDLNNMQDQSTVSGPFYFYRGKIEDKRGKRIRKPENTWDCDQRLADEVDWRAFFVSGTFYWISEKDLFSQQPIFILDEFDQGIQGVDFNYDNNKKAATVTIIARVGRWLAPPGSVVVLQGMGPVNGRWLVNDFTRDLIGDSRDATITLKKPRPKLPEPSPQGNASDINASWATPATTPAQIPQAGSTSQLIENVLKNKMITFSSSLETSDIKLGQIYNPLLEFLQWITLRQGIAITITAMKSDHSQLTSEGRVSAHSVGRAVDIGIVAGVLCGDNDQTAKVMDLIRIYQLQLGFDQLIGPFPLRCIPKGYYDRLTLSQHKTHIHVGWPV